VGKEIPVSTVRSLVVLSLILCGLALTLANIVPREAGPMDVSVLLRRVSEITVQLLMALGLLLLLWYVLRNLRVRQKGGRARRGVARESILPTLVMLAVIVMVMVVLPGLISQHNDIDDGEGTTDGDDPSAPVPQEEGGGYTLFLPFFLLISTGTLLALFWFHLRDRDRPMAVSTYGPAPEREGPDVRWAMEIVGTQKDVREAILSVYRRLLELVSWDGSSNLTARELAKRLVEGSKWPRDPTLDLTWLFEEARYSRHHMGEEERDMALRDLGEIESWLTGGDVDAG
jgi:hypothetical protein